MNPCLAASIRQSERVETAIIHAGLGFDGEGLFLIFFFILPFVYSVISTEPVPTRGKRTTFTWYCTLFYARPIPRAKH